MVSKRSHFCIMYYACLSVDMHGCQNLDQLPKVVSDTLGFLFSYQKFSSQTSKSIMCDAAIFIIKTQEERVRVSFIILYS